MAKSSGSSPGAKALERDVNPVKQARPSGKPGVKAMEKEVNPVKKGKAGASSSKVGGTNFSEKRSRIRATEKKSIS